MLGIPELIILSVLGLFIVAIVVVVGMLDLVSSRIENAGLVLLPIGGWTSLLLCVGLVLYLAGLFAPLRRGRI